MTEEIAPTRQSTISLRPVTAETVRQICNLKVSEAQNRFVAPNAISIAQAYFEPKAWFRAIYADETPVGFVMLYDDPDEPTYYLWRFMIDARYQKLGFGQRAMDLLVEHVRTRPNAQALYLSCVPYSAEPPYNGSPEPFYARYGFVLTGKMHEGEAEMRLGL